MNIWLAYVNYPVTTAAYLERALRSMSQVVTIGPRLPEQLLNEWQLQNMKLPLTDQDIITDFMPDMAAIWSETQPAEKPDLYLWVESVGGYYPQNLTAVTCPKACYLIDSHLNLEKHLIWAQQFDHVFIAQQEYLSNFLQVNGNSHWLPLACDPEIHARQPVDICHDISFVGSLVFNPRRQYLLELLKQTIPVHIERCFWKDMANVFSASRIVFNSAVKNDLNMRFFEALCSGSLLLSDMAKNSGQDELFRDGEDYACYSDDLLADTARFYLENGALREMIAERGRALVLNAHTYTHRMKDLVAVSLQEKSGTWTASELREQSVNGLEQPFLWLKQQQIHLGQESRSFVIPVLDYSPASPYNITTLLADLEGIPGEVVVIFNNQSIGEELKNHPRITRSAIMSENIGVARAWNVGISMATTPYVIILNADLHIKTPVIDAIENGLRTLEFAACVGPQGSFVNYRLTKDFLYFDKGSFDQPVEVDAVSGFLFGIRRELFGPGGLKFEESYTPCYFEEWDLGLQIKQMGHKSWIIPSSTYDHKWGGSIGARREIACMGRSESAQEILQRNRILFLAKWRKAGNLPESGWRSFGPDYALTMLQQGPSDHTRSVIQLLGSSYPELPEVQALSIGLALQENDMKTVAEGSKRLHRIDPGFDLEVFLRRAVARL